MRLALAVLLLAAACKAPSSPGPAKAGPPAVGNVQAVLEQRLERQLAALAAAYGGQRWDEHARLTAGALELLFRYDADTLRGIDGPLLTRMHQHGGPYLGVAIELAWRLGRAPTAGRRRALDTLRAAAVRPAWRGQSLVVIGDRTAERPELLSENAGWFTLMLQVSPLGENMAAGGAGPEAMPRIAELLVACEGSHGATSSPAHGTCKELEERVEHALGGKEAAAPLLQEMEQAVDLGMLIGPLPCVLPGVREAAARFDEAAACAEPRWTSLLQAPLLGPGTTLPDLPAPAEITGPGLPRLGAAPAALHARLTRDGLQLTSFRDAAGRDGDATFRARQLLEIAPGQPPRRSLLVERTDPEGTTVTRYGEGGTVAKGPPGRTEAPCSPGWDLGPAPSRLDGLALPPQDEPLVSEAMASCLTQRRAAPHPCGGVTLCARGNLNPVTCTCTGSASEGGALCSLARCTGAACDPATASCRIEEATPEPHLGPPSPAHLAVPDPAGELAALQGASGSSKPTASAGTSSTTSTSP